MNKKGVTVIELMIVLVVIGILAGVGAVSAVGILTNIKEKGFVASADVILDAGKRAYTEDRPLWGDDIFTLDEIIEAGYLEPLKADPWGGTYDLDESYIEVTTNGTSPATFKITLVTSRASIGLDEPLGEFTKSDIVLVE